jgi:hypothetical protein
MELNNNMEIISLFPSPLARIRIDKYFKDEVWYLKKGYELNSIECIALVEYIEEQVELYMRNVIGLKAESKYEIDDLAVVKTWEECSDHFSWSDGLIVAQGVLSLEVPNNLCKLAVYCFSGMREHLYDYEITGESPWFQTWNHIPMAENELIIVPGSDGPSIDELHDQPAMFVVFNIKTK